eukprot:TRINITY_DN841_c0_g1_i2.p1 TRINITY_DN841_c0_g1~~TRINITY_DN841_c0_g1_i2.p1  ORF type:complete len:518 (+),score=122.67 TRINITY_DN841_c0_g1_i2:103-1656(+)
MQADFYAKYVGPVGSNGYELLLEEETKSKKKEPKKVKNVPRDGNFDGEVIEFAHLKEEKQKKQEKQGKKQKKEKVKTEKRSAKDATSSLDNKKMKEAINHIAAKYPENYDLQLKTIAEYLEETYKNTKEEKPNNTEFPVGYLPKEMLSTIKDTFNKASDDTLAVFFWFLVSTLVSVSDDSTRGVGLKILIQIMANNYPGVLSKNVSNIRDAYVQNSYLMASSFGPLLWVFKQFVLKHPSVATLAWFNFLFPYLSASGKEELKNASLDYIESTLKSKRTGFLDDATAVSIYEKLLDYKHSASNMTQRVKALLSSLTDPGFLFPAGSVSKKFFSSLFSQAATDNDLMREEVLRVLASCLAQDPSTFKVWQDLHPQHVSESNSLMVYIYKNWEMYSSKISPAGLVKLAENIVAINKRLGSGAVIDKKSKTGGKKPSAAELKEIGVCTQTCQAIQKKLQHLADAEEAQKEREKNNSSDSIGIVIPSVILAGLGAGAYLLFINCCTMDWCRSNDFLTQYIKC